MTDLTALEGAKSPPPPPRRRRWVGVLAAVVAVVAVVGALAATGVIALHPAAAARTVDITSTSLAFSPGSNPCFGSGYANSTALHVPAGGLVEFVVPLTNLDPEGVHSCTVTGVAVNTTGFALVSSNTPLLVPAAGANLLITVSVPQSEFAGALNLSANTNYTLPDVQVQNVGVSFSNPSLAGQCGFATEVGLGFDAFSGSSYNTSIGLLILNALDICSVTDVASQTPGFTVLSFSPSGGTEPDSFLFIGLDLGMPDTSYNGNVTVEITFVA